MNKNSPLEACKKAIEFYPSEIRRQFIYVSNALEVPEERARKILRDYYSTFVNK